MKIRIGFVFVMAMAMGTGCAHKSTSIFKEPTETTNAVIQHHWDQFFKGNLDAVMKDYTEDSMLIANGTVIKDLAGIRGVFQALLTEFGKPGSKFEIDQATKVIDSGVVWFTFTAETPDNVYEFGSDTFVIQDGKIALQTIALKVRPKTK